MDNDIIRPTQSREPVDQLRPQPQTITPAENSIIPSPAVAQTPPLEHKSRKKMYIMTGLIAVVLIALISSIVIFHPFRTYKSTTKLTGIAKAGSLKTNAAMQQAATTKSYGNKYANGLLPVGDGKYSTTTPSTGNIYVCHAPTAQSGGAGTRGYWFTNNNTQWDMNKKPSVQGAVHWTPSLSIKIVNGKRIIVTNDLPSHITGVFPIASSDPVYKYDANPSKISAQTLSYSLDANPTAAAKPSCMGGESGVMTSGVPIFSGFDASGRDAGAWEVQDGCDGHPQNSGEYHYHTLSRCITSQNYTTVIGFALDGFPITGPKVGDNNIITTADLDACHGMTGPVTLDGKNTVMYHYVMTQDFPYSVSCFKGTPSQPPHASTAKNAASVPPSPAVAGSAQSSTHAPLQQAQSGTTPQQHPAASPAGTPPQPRH